MLGIKYKLYHMKNILKLLLITVFLGLVSSCVLTRKKSDPGIVITPFSDTVKLRDAAIVYSLPRTVLTFAVVMERVVEKPGPYERYAGDLLGLTDIIHNESESWSVVEVSLRSASEPDPSARFMIETNSLFQTNAIHLKEMGLIMDLNPDYISPNTLKLPSDLNGLYTSSLSDFGSDEYYLIQKDTAYKRVAIDSSFVRVPYIVEKKKRLSVEQLAERAAKRLMELRDGKHMILTGEANVFPQSDAAIKEINRMEKEYIELFAGKRWSQKLFYTFNLIPDKSLKGKPVTLLNYSELTGPDVSSVNAIPVVVELIPEQSAKPLMQIKRTVPEEGSIVYDKLFYRVPDMVNLKVTADKEILLNTRQLIYQYGEVIPLPANYILGK